jgi:hypothetical protein
LGNEFFFLNSVQQIQGYLRFRLVTNSSATGFQEKLLNETLKRERGKKKKTVNKNVAREKLEKVNGEGLDWESEENL